ncbi:ATP-binding protein [Aliihoeflea sp. 2WW]|uniref:ATP-binding protein n=1 Tax=Aliihoeflea sp. 2WW TaxID=1381123 RepID=UPI0004677E93|nr:ATP-binding protein [Aliihoeflea sp. 2WW]
MASDSSASLSSARRLGARWRMRLRDQAVVVCVSLGAIALVAGVAGRPILGLIAAMAVLAAAIMGAGAPRRQPAISASPRPLGSDSEHEAHPSGLELAAAIADPLIVCDANGVVLIANAAASLAFGRIQPGELVALRFRSPEMHDLIEAALAGSHVRPIDYAERVPIKRSFKVSVTRIGEDGRFALHFRDQSEARRIDRMRADFIANASHELRTPLASISGFIETLRGPARNDAEARERFLQIMHTQTGRMARLIDDLLSLSRLEMKPLAGAGTAVDLVALTRQVTDSLGQMIRDNEMELSLDLPAQPVRVLANADEIVQVVENLVENACKYGQAGKRLDITLSSDDEEAALSVRDHGPGIPAEHIPRVTERFYRVDVETSRVQKGTGLGLAIVKHILTRHKGRLTIRSTPGDGATFTMHLPLAKDQTAR